MQKLLTVLLLGWGIAFFGSFIAFYLTPARDFGLSGGWNKMTVFMGWQFVAVVLALCSMVLRWSTGNPRLKRLAAIPAMATSVLLTVAAVALFWSNTRQIAPEGEQPPGPVTAPAPTVDG